MQLKHLKRHQTAPMTKDSLVLKVNTAQRDYSCVCQKVLSEVAQSTHAHTEEVEAGRPPGAAASAGGKSTVNI